MALYPIKNELEVPCIVNVHAPVMQLNGLLQMYAVVKTQLSSLIALANNNMAVSVTVLILGVILFTLRCLGLL